MALRLPYVTMVDRTLDHQVVFHKQGREWDISVSCNCRRVGQEHESMGYSSTLDMARRLYNDPSNHRKPFTKEDEARW